MAQLTPEQLEELRGHVAEREADELEARPAPSPAQGEEPGFFRGTSASGVRNHLLTGAIVGIANTVDFARRTMADVAPHAAPWSPETATMVGDWARAKLPTPENDPQASGVEGIAHELGKVLPLAIATRRLIPIAPSTGAKEVAASGIAGGVAEGLALRPEQKGLLDFAADLGAPVPDWLQTDPNGDPYEQAARNALEGTLLGTAGDVALRSGVGGVRWLLNRWRGARGVAEVVTEVTGELPDIPHSVAGALDDVAQAERALVDHVAAQLDPEDVAPAARDSADQASLQAAQDAIAGTTDSVPQAGVLQQELRRAQGRLEEVIDSGILDDAPKEVRRQIAERLPTRSPRRREILDALREEPDEGDLVHSLLTRRRGTTPPPDLMTEEELVRFQRDVVDQRNPQAAVESLRPVFNRTTMNSSEEVHRVILNLSDYIQEQVGRQVTKPWVVEDEAAREMLTDVDRLAAVGRELEVATDAMGSWMGAARTVTRGLGEHLHELSMKLDTPEATIDDWTEFARKSDILRDVTQSLQGVRTSVGRALNYSKRVVDDDFVNDTILNGPLADDDGIVLVGGRPSKALQQRAAAMRQARTPRERNQSAALTKGQILRGMLVQNYIQSLLSGTKTVGTNIFNFAMYSKRFYFDAPLGAALSESPHLKNVPRTAVRNMLMQHSLDMDRFRTFGRSFFEVMPEPGQPLPKPKLRDRARVFKERVTESSTYRAFVTGEGQLDPNRSIDEPSTVNFFDPAVTGQLLPDNNFGHGMSWFLKMYEKANGFGTRLLTTSDEFVKQISFNAKINEIGMQQAFREGITEPADVRRFLQDFTADDDAVQAAMQEARRITLTADPDSEVGKWFQNFLGRFPMMRLAVPIYKAPVRALNEFTRMTPVANALVNGESRRAWGKMLRREALTQAEGEEVAATIGGTLMWGAAMAAGSAGLIRGAAPIDSRARAGFLADGLGENVIVVGGRAISYDRAAPFGLILSSVGTLNRLNHEMGIDPDPDHVQRYYHYAQTLFAGMRRAVGSQSMFQTFGKLMIAIEDEDDDRAERLLMQHASGHLPLSGAMRQLELDPLFRELRDLEDVLLASNPITSSSVLARRDPFGNERERPPGFGPPLLSLFSPFAEYEQSESRGLQEIARLGMTIDQRRFRVPVGDGNNALELTSEQSAELYDLYRDTELYEGRNVQQQVDWLVEQDWYQNDLVDGEGAFSRTDAIRAIMDDYFQDAKIRHSQMPHMVDLYDRARMIDELGYEHPALLERFPDGLNFNN